MGGGGARGAHAGQLDRRVWADEPLTPAESYAWRKWASQQSKVYVLQCLRFSSSTTFGHSCCAAETCTHSAYFTVQEQFLGKVVVPVVAQRQVRGSMVQQTADFQQLQSIEGRRLPFRAAEADPHGPAFSEVHGDSAVAVCCLVVDAPVVQVVLGMPVVVHDRCAWFRLCRNLWRCRTCSSFMVVDVAVSRSDKFSAVREVPQTRSSTGCPSVEEV